MKKQRHTENFQLTPEDNQRLAKACGQFDENLRQIERHLGVEINNRGHDFYIIGTKHSVETAKNVLLQLYAKSAEQTHLNSTIVSFLLQNENNFISEKTATPDLKECIIETPCLKIQARSANQLHYIKNILSHDISFGVGPSGTGKTYLAVACAVQALTREEVNRIILVRPAVEAGEKLGFLPGNLSEKVDPYLKPLYDALYEMLGNEKVNRLIEKNVIEVAPLAYMRGRTLNDAFIILDESQNTTKEQMKMFLTRIGFGSKALITGDITQIDLPHHQGSGLRHVIEVLKDVEEIHFTFFQSHDVVRHPLVQKIVQAYEKKGD